MAGAIYDLIAQTDAQFLHQVLFVMDYSVDSRDGASISISAKSPYRDVYPPYPERIRNSILAS